MYQGKHTNNAAHRSSAPRRKRRLRWRREFVLFCSIVVLLIGVIGGTLAYLVTSTGDVKNVFTPPSVGVDITENFDGEVKENVKFTNTSDFPVYMRATYVANWVNDKDNSVYPGEPKLNVTFGNGWEQNGSYWYYNQKVASGEDSGIFIEKLEAAETMEGYHLEVEIIVETVQAEPANAINDVWGVTAPDASNN